MIKLIHNLKWWRQSLPAMIEVASIRVDMDYDMDGKGVVGVRGHGAFGRATFRHETHRHETHRHETSSGFWPSFFNLT